MCNLRIHLKDEHDQGRVTDLRINVAPILHERGAQLEVDQRANIPASFIVDGNAKSVDVYLLGTLTNAGKSIVFSGRVSASVPVNCHRCLRDFVLPINSKVLEEFHRRPVGLVTDEETEDVQPEDDDGYVFTGNTIDLGEMVREYLVLAMPIKTVCSPECRGICRVCGQDLNQGDCQCKIDDFNPRFAVLGELLEKMKEEE
jgi:uncharacterized protein